MTEQRILAVDLGGTKINAALAEAGGRILAEKREATALDRGRGLVTQLMRLGRLLTAEAGVMDLHAVAVGGAGSADEASGTFADAPNLGDVAEFDLRDELERAFHTPVVLENDVNVAALGELSHGIGIVHDDFAVVAVGTGIGVGLVLGRQLIRGSTGAAGEIGYLPFGLDPFDPSNHRRGALEEVVAGDALRARVPDALDVPDVFARAALGDQAATRALDVEAQHVALAIAATEAVANPARFVLSGGIGSRPELLRLIRDHLDRLGRRSLTVEISMLGERGAILGAIELGHRHLTRLSHQGSSS